MIVRSEWTCPQHVLQTLLRSSYRSRAPFQTRIRSNFHCWEWTLSHIWIFCPENNPMKSAWIPEVVTPYAPVRSHGLQFKGICLSYVFIGIKFVNVDPAISLWFGLHGAVWTAQSFQILLYAFPKRPNEILSIQSKVNVQIVLNTFISTNDNIRPNIHPGHLYVFNRRKNTDFTYILPPPIFQDFNFPSQFFVFTAQLNDFRVFSRLSVGSYVYVVVAINRRRWGECWWSRTERIISWKRKWLCHSAMCRLTRLNLNWLSPTVSRWDQSDDTVWIQGNIIPFYRYAVQWPIYLFSRTVGLFSETRLIL